jgi:hypothetical protein
MASLHAGPFFLLEKGASDGYHKMTSFTKLTKNPLSVLAGPVIVELLVLKNWKPAPHLDKEVLKMSPIATLTDLVRTVEDRTRRLQPVDVGTRMDGWQYDFEENNLPGRMIKLTDNPARQTAFELTRRAQCQLLSRLNIPVSYFDRCPAKLKNIQANFWAQRGGYDREVMVRSVEGQRARAILSQAYTPLDDYDVVPLIADILGDYDLTIAQSDFTEDYTHLRILFNQTRTEARAGDVVQTGVHISNSEVGLRAVHFEPLVYRLVCTNGLVRPEGQGKTSIRHIGNPARLKDTLRNAIEDAREGTQLLVKQFKAAIDADINDWESLIKSTATQAQLSRSQMQNALDAWLEEKDETLYGVVNAFTRAAQREETFEERYQLERVGGALLSRVSRN